MSGYVLEQGDTSGASVCVDCGEGIAAGEVQRTPRGDLCAACMVQAGSVAVSDPFNPWRAPCGASWYGLRDGSPDDGCGWGDLCDAPRDHWHVATGLAGYGPEGADGFVTFSTLSDALEYARDEISTFVDMAHEDAHACGAAGMFEDAWREVLRIEDLESWRANLDPARRSAPLYREDPAAYASMQEEQAAQFPRDVSYNTRLYLWQCEDPATCEHGEEGS